MANTPATNKQVPDHAILDFYNKQTYLGNQFVFSETVGLTGTSENPMLLIKNPAVTSTAFPASNLALFQNLMKVTCTTAAANVILRIYLGPTVLTAGTAAAALNLRPASATTSVAAITTIPSVSANGKFLSYLCSSAFVPDSSQLLSIVDPGQTILITAQASGNSNLLFEMAWYEL